MALYFNSDKLAGDPGRDLVTKREDIAVARSMSISTIDPKFQSAGIDSFPSGSNGINIKQKTMTFYSSDTAYYLLKVGDYFAYRGYREGGPAVGIAHVSHQGGSGTLVILGAAWTESLLLPGVSDVNDWRIFALPIAAEESAAEIRTIATEVDAEA